MKLFQEFRFLLYVMLNSISVIDIHERICCALSLLLIYFRLHQHFGGSFLTLYADRVHMNVAVFMDIAVRIKVSGHVVVVSHCLLLRWLILESIETVAFNCQTHSHC